MTSRTITPALAGFIGRTAGRRPVEPSYRATFKVHGTLGGRRLTVRQARFWSRRLLDDVTLLDDSGRVVELVRCDGHRDVGSEPTDREGGMPWARS